MAKRNRFSSWSLRFLGWFCKPYYLEIIEGDLLEIYYRELDENPRRAKWHLVWNVLRFFRLRFLKNVEDYRLTNSYGMFKNYFKVSVRNMLRQKAFTAFNILGLAVGVASCLLIIMHITFQLSYDKDLKDVNQVYRVVNDWGYAEFNGWTSPRLVNQLLIDFPEIEAGARAMGPESAVIKKGDSYVTQEGIILADSTFFDVFPTNFLAGTPEDALNEPNTAVLTKQAAEKLFAGEDAFGQFLEIDETVYVVKAIVEDMPKNTTIPYQVILNVPHSPWFTSGYWTGNSCWSFIKLKQNADPKGLEYKFPEFVRKYIAPEMVSYLPQYDSWDDYLEENTRSLAMVPMIDVHLHQPRLDLGKGGDYQNIIIFSIVTAFILLIACINYVNMSTAKSSLRAKEVGMRKVLGSVRANVIQQFLTESMVVTTISVALGIGFAMLFLPFFNILTEIDYSFNDLLNPMLIVWVLILVLVIGLLAGSYPSLYLASFKPINALRGDTSKGGNKNVRTFLVVFQFAISIVLIAGTFIVFQQVTFMSDRELGLNTDRVFVLRNGEKLDERFEAFRNTLMNSTFVDQVGVTSLYPSGFIADWNYKTVGDDAISLGPDHMFVDETALQTMGFSLVEGEFFSGKSTDTLSVIINESFVKAVGWEEPIGQLLERGGNEGQFRVIGVVKDVVLRHGRRNIRPALFRYDNKVETGRSGGPYIEIAMSGDLSDAVSFVESTWSDFVPGYPFDGFFLDDSFNRLYNGERRFGKIFTTFSFLAMLIASVGLFALAAFTLERRMKEIAIRKVLGATVPKVMGVILWDFLKLILLAAVIAIPATWYLGNGWLENYDYRITIQPFLLAAPVIMVCFIALFTVGYRSFVAANDNPVNALKQE